MKSVLDGIRVLEWSYFHLGPVAASILGDLGAEVVKIEDPVAGDPSRGVEMGVGGIPLINSKNTSAYWEGYNRNKKSIAVDLKKEEGRQVIYRLLPKFDVFLTTFRRRAVEKLGMDYETLKQYNPRLVYGLANAFGPKGPDSDLPGLDLDGQFRAGLAMMQQKPEQGPSIRFGLGDQGGSICMAFGIIAALLARERLGIGQKIETSLLGSAIWLEYSTLCVTLPTGQDPRPFDRPTNVNPLYNFYRASDGDWFCLSMAMRTDSWWHSFCLAIEHPEFEDDPRFRNQAIRRDNRVEFIKILDGIFSQRTAAEWLERFAEFDVPASRANQLTDLPNDPQVMANQYIIEYDDPVLGKQKASGFPVTMSETPWRMSREPPQHGQHTEEVLMELGGYTWDDISSFKQKEIIP